MTDTTYKNDTVYFTRLHWIIFFLPVACFALSCFLYLYFSSLRQPSLVVMAAFAFWILMTWATYQFSSITIKARQVILRTGILVRQTVDIPLGKIETIDIRQSILGSLFQYGTLIITGTGGTRHFIHYLNKPLTCRRYIEQLMNEPGVSKV